MEAAVVDWWIQVKANLVNSRDQGDGVLRRSGSAAKDKLEEAYSLRYPGRQ